MLCPLANAFDITNQGSPPSPKDCPTVYVGNTDNQGKVVEIKSQADIACPRVGNTTPYGGGSPRSNTDQPDGTTCTVFYYAPVTFQNLPAYILARWSSPSGQQARANVDPQSNGGLVTQTGQQAPTRDVFGVFSKQGQVQNQQCVPSGPWQNFCREGGPVRQDDPPCVFSEPHPITPATSPPPPITPYVAQVLGNLQANAGTILSLPSPNGLVNLPTCFWVDAMTVPDERTYTVLLPGPPDPSNRRIYFTYLIRVFFAGIDWNFDDPFGNAEVQPHPACGQHPQLTAHSYQMISEKQNPDGRYHVVATEKYQVTVDLYWSDSTGAHHQPIDPGVPLPVTISPGTYSQFVGQVEGIPMTG
jgi:hypothetical protein